MNPLPADARWRRRPGRPRLPGALPPHVALHSGRLRVPPTSSTTPRPCCLLEQLFGVPVPNLSAWRRSVTGDMTRRWPSGQPANDTVPTLPAASLVEPDGRRADHPQRADRHRSTRASPTPRRPTTPCRARRRLEPARPQQSPEGAESCSGRRTFSRRSVLRAGSVPPRPRAWRRGRPRHRGASGAGRHDEASQGPARCPIPSLPGRAVHGCVPLRPHRAGDAGEPLVRQLPRHAARSAASPRPTASHSTRRTSRSTGIPIGDERMYVYHQSGAIGAQDSGIAVLGRLAPADRRRAMEGFAGTGPGSMGYYTEDDLPFYYSLANTFTLANRWFCSVPAQTYPNRRFSWRARRRASSPPTLDNVTTYPANGTIWDQLSAHGISVEELLQRCADDRDHSGHHLPLPGQPHLTSPSSSSTPPPGRCPRSAWSTATWAPFRARSRASSVSCRSRCPTFAATPDLAIETTCQSEENPEDVQLGRAVRGRRGQRRDGGSGLAAHPAGLALRRARWATTTTWRPRRRSRPTTSRRTSVPSDQPGGYNLYGPRVPVVVVSPYARPHDVTNVVHDHTSVLATIEQQWNLPA